MKEGDTINFPERYFRWQDNSYLGLLSQTKILFLKR